MEKCKSKLFNNGQSNLEKTFKMLRTETSKEIIESVKNNEEYEIISNEKKKKEKKRKKIFELLFIH